MIVRVVKGDNKLHIFVGYDSREHACFQVLEYNLGSYGHTVHPVNHRQLRDAKKFSREWIIKEDGQYEDLRDRKPFSTEFSHSRFVSIPMAREMGIHEWCMFVDTDFLFLRDPTETLQLIALGSSGHALACVQYDWHETEGIKMDGMLQLLYDRKLWSSMFLFNPDHPCHDWLTFHRVNWESGASMHAFKWVPDNLIAKIDNRWNYVPSYTDPLVKPSAIHWSYGGPWMPGFEEVEYAGLWRETYHSTLQYMVAHNVARNPALVAAGRIK